MSLSVIPARHAVRMGSSAKIALTVIRPEGSPPSAQPWRALAPPYRAHTNRRNTQSDSARRTKILFRDKPVTSHIDGRSGADPEAGATTESALRWCRCRNPRDAPSADSGGGERGGRRIDGRQLRAHRDRATARGAPREAEAQPTSSRAVADRRGPDSAGAELALVHGLPHSRAWPCTHLRTEVPRTMPGRGPSRVRQ